MDLSVRRQLVVEHVTVDYLETVQDFVEPEFYLPPYGDGDAMVRTWPRLAWERFVQGSVVSRSGPGRYHVHENRERFDADHEPWEAPAEVLDPPLPAGAEWCTNSARTRRHLARWLAPQRHAPRMPGRAGRGACGHNVHDQERADYWARREGKPVKDIATIPLCRLCVRSILMEAK